jgi:hypothetical protein
MAWAGGATGSDEDALASGPYGKPGFTARSILRAGSCVRCGERVVRGSVTRVGASGLGPETR